MIPQVNPFLTEEIELKQQPSKNYRMDIENEVIHGKIDYLDAMKQVIYKILNTERYQYVIYSWNYGIELFDLFGEPVTYVCPELKRRITEALVQDNRITSVDEFEFKLDGHTVTAAFTVHTIFGNVQMEKVVEI